MLAFRAKRLQGEALAALRDAAGVERVQGELERWARQLGLHPTAATILGPPQAPVEKVDARTLAQMWADETPEMLARIEDDTMHSLQLPEERRPILQRDLEATQRAHREQFDHCRHLQVLQDLRHTQSRDTYYAGDPGRVGKCALFGYESQIENVATVISAFKRAYCDGCPRREPFQRT